MKVISIANQKGGVGKTTTSYNLAYNLTQKTKRVLCIDLDPQANLTKLLGIFDEREIKYSITDLLESILEDLELPEEKEYIHSNFGIDFIPTNKKLILTDVRLQTELGTDTILKSLIDRFKDKYDYIIFDLPPTFNSLTMNALTCSDEIIIPMKCELLSLVGLNDFIYNVNKIKKRLNKNLEIKGILLTMVDDRLKLTKIIKENLSMMNLNLKIFNTEISKSTEIGKSELIPQPIGIFNKNHKISKEYENLAVELIEME